VVFPAPRHVIINIIPFGSPQYEAMKQFREAILRRPIGLTLRDVDVQDEQDQTHIAAFDDQGSLIGTLVLKPLSASRVRLRQMAVSPLLQRSGIGTTMVRFAENHAKESGFTLIELHARRYAQGFYEKLGYRTSGDYFSEVTLPTIKMVKRLS